MKKCPYCAEEIQDDAAKCRYCNESLKKKKKWKGCLIGCLIAIAVAVILIALFLCLSFFLVKFFIRKMISLPSEFYSPFVPPNIEFMFGNFSDFFRSLWEKIMELLHFGSLGHTL